MATATMNEEFAERLLSHACKGLPKADDTMRGPTSTSCWLVPKLILWGDAPSGTRLAALVDAGVTHFLDVRTALQSSNGGMTPDTSPARRTVHLDLSRMLAENSQAAISSSAAVLKRTLTDVLSFPNGVLYVFCEDGHSLSCVAACAFLSMVYSVSGLKALTVASQLHGVRVDDGGVRQLLSPMQKAFVRDVVQDPTPIGGLSNAVAAAVPAPLDSASDSQRVGRPASSRFAYSQGSSGGGPTSFNLFNGLPSVPPLASVAAPTYSAARSPTDALSSERDNSMCSVPSDAHAVSSNSPARDPVGATVIALQRPTPAHSWGVVFDGATVRHVLPMSPAERAGVCTGWVLRAVDSGEFSPHESFDWLTRERIYVLLTWAIGPPAPSCGSPTRAGESPQSRSSSTTDVSSRAGNVFRSAAPTAAMPFSGEVLLLDPKEPGIAAVRGPFPQSNWVVRGLLLCGPLPDPRKVAQFSKIAALQFSAFVSLVEQSAWNQSYLSALSSMQPGGFPPPQLLWLPLEDGAPLPGDKIAAVRNLLCEMMRLLDAGNKIYVHCRNGHGRTGIIVSLFLALRFGLSGMHALNRCDALHHCREDAEGESSPQTQEQRLSVLTTLKALQAETQ